MRLTSLCFAFLLVGTALAGPVAEATEKKSLDDATKSEMKKTELNVEETGEDKDRSKKSAATFCVQIDSDIPKAPQVPCQTMNVVQSVPQANIVVPRQVVQPFPQPVHTLQIIQPVQQPCPQSVPAVNFVQSVPQTSVVQTTSRPKAKPKPTPSPVVEMKTEAPVPARVELAEPLPIPRETIQVLPAMAMAPCREELSSVPPSRIMLLPELEKAQLATIFQLPSVSPCSNPLHNVLSPCPCQTANLLMLGQSNPQPVAMEMMPFVSHSSAGSSGMVSPYAKTLPQIPSNAKSKAGHEARTHHVKVNLPSHLHHDPGHYTAYQKMYFHGTGINPMAGRGLLESVYPESAPGLTINAYPSVYRSASPTLKSSLAKEQNASNNPVASEVGDLTQSTKFPRNVQADQSVEKKEDSPRTNKEETTKTEE